MANKELKVGNVPNLRFPGFEEEWEVKKLSDDSQFYSGGTPLTSKKEYFNGEIPFIRSGEINANKTEQHITQKGLNNSSAKMVYVGDLLYALYGATSGEVGISKINGAINQAVLCIKSRNDHYFLANYLRLQKENIIKTYLQGGQGNLSADIVKKLKISIPSLKEQQKITSFIILIDQRIETQNKIIRELNVLKTNALKRIFSQDLRFKNNDGNNYPNWEEKRLKDLFIFKTTNSFSREKLNYENGKVKNIHYGDIHTKFQTLFDMEREQVPYINSNIDINKINEDNYCKVGDIIFADASEDLKDVGKSIEIINLNNQKILAGLHTLLARPTINTFSIGFCGHLFASDIVRMQIQKESQGSKVLSISAIRLSNISLSVPDLEEQSKITNFLSSIDSKIDIENQLLQKLEEQKKFLLYQMFV
jgi:type I restriction enzyme S subunit